MIVSFCFTIKIINSINNLEIYQKMISKVVDCAKKYHKVKFYTDNETLSYLDIEGVEIELIDTNNFYFIDDFKVHLLSIISNEEILVDTDLFLFSELKLEEGKDIYVDFKDNSEKYWYGEYINWFIENGITDILPDFYKKNIQVPNIGILKIENEELKSEYINLYCKIRKWVLNKDIQINRGVSIILGQYLLALLIQNKKYKISYCFNDYNYYYHLSGPIKFENDIIDKTLSKINKKLI